MLGEMCYTWFVISDLKDACSENSNNGFSAAIYIDIIVDTV